jgi:hypothetical protein
MRTERTIAADRTLMLISGGGPDAECALAVASGSSPDGWPVVAGLADKPAGAASDSSF